MRLAGGDLDGFALAPAAIERWVYAAKAGEVLVYARGASLPRTRGSERARALAEAGLIGLVQRPPVDGAFDFVAQRLRQKLVCAAIPRGRAKPALAPDERRVLDAIRSAARRGRHQPSYRQIARIAGLPSRSRAQYLVRKLRERGVIDLQAVAS